MQKFLFSFFRQCTAELNFFLHFRQNFDELLPPNVETNTVQVELKQSLDVYHASARFLSLFQEQNQEHCDRLERLCRYLIASLESDSPKTSYIGVALNKDLSLAWIRHIKMLLYYCCCCMRQLKPENHRESISLALYLRTLIAFTSTSSWALLKSKNLASLKAGMIQLCNNIMGGLVQKGFFQSLRVSMRSGTNS